MRHLEPKVPTEDALGFLTHGGDNRIYFIGGHMSRLAYEGQRNTCGRGFSRFITWTTEMVFRSSDLATSTCTR